MADCFDADQLHFAAQDGDLEKARELVENGYDVNAFDSDVHYTPLHYAAVAEQLEIVRYLLSVGADINAHDVRHVGETPLGAVARNCSYELAEILINAGADPSIPGWMQCNALHHAKRRKKLEGRRVYKLLLSAAAF